MRIVLILFRAFALLLLVSIPVIAQDASSVSVGPDKPDVTGWKLVVEYKISVNATDRVGYYLGYDLTFQNPQNPNEFVRQVRLLLPFITVKSNNVLDKNFTDMAMTYVTDGAERELIKGYLEKSDPVLYVRWRVKDDIDRVSVKKDGDHEVWLWNAQGNWVYQSGVTVKFEFLSETFKELNDELVVVGRKYSINKKDYVAREVPYAYIIIAIRPPKKGK